MTDLVEDLPIQQSVPLAWQAPYQGPDYWTAHCSAVIEDLLEMTTITPVTLHQTLRSLQDCVGEQILFPWVLDEGLRALQHFYQQEASTQELYDLVTKHRCFLRDQLLQQPLWTTQLLKAELRYHYRHWAQGQCRWRDVVQTIADYSRVLPAYTLQQGLDLLRERLKILTEEGELTSTQYQRGNKLLRLVRKKLQDITSYSLLETSFDQEEIEQCTDQMLIPYEDVVIGGLTIALTVQTLCGSLIPTYSMYSVTARQDRDIDLSSRFNNAYSAMVPWALSTSFWVATPLLHIVAHHAFLPISPSTVGVSSAFFLFSLSQANGITIQEQIGCDAGNLPSEVFFFEPNGVNGALDITSLMQGGWVVVWASQGQSGSDLDIYAQRYAINGTAVETKFLVNTDTSGNQNSPVVAALEDGGWVVVWTTDGESYDIYAQRYMTNATMMGAEFRVNTYTSSVQGGPAVTALQDGGWVVVWTHSEWDSYEVYGQRYAVDGTVVGPEFRVNTYTSVGWYENNPAVTALQDGGWVVIWAYNYGLYGQRYAFDSTEVGSEFKVTEDDISYPSIPAVAALQDGGWVTVWWSDSGEYLSRRYAVDGIPVGSEFQINRNEFVVGDQYDLSVAALHNGGWVVIWASEGRYYGRRYDAQGYPVLTVDQSGYWWEEFTFCSDCAYTRVAANPNYDQWLIAWIGTYLVSVEIQTYNHTGAIINYLSMTDFEFLVSTYTYNSKDQSSFSAVSILQDGGWVVVWVKGEQNKAREDIYGQRYAANGITVGSRFRINSNGERYQYSPAITGLQDGGWVVVWESKYSVGYYTFIGDVNGQRYAVDGTVVGSEFRANTYTVCDQCSPAITTLQDGGWMVVWNSYGEDSLGWGIYSRRYTIEGIAIGIEFQLNTYTTGLLEESPVVAALQDGGLVVVWIVFVNDGSSDNDTVYGQRYAVDGTVVGSEFRINTYSEGHQYSPAVTTLQDGGWVVVWTDKKEIYGQRYAVDGTTVGMEFQVNTVTVTTSTWNDPDPAVAALEDGGWVIVWTSEKKDGSEEGVSGQRYAVNGSMVKTEFRVNTYIKGSQNMPAITALQDGGWFVVWTSYGQDGTISGIYGQRYTNTGERVAVQIPMFLTFPLSASMREVSLQTQAQILSLGGKWLFVWEQVRISMSQSPNVIAESAFFMIRYNDYGTLLDEGTNEAIPCFLNVSQTCVQPWQIVLMSVEHLLLVWGDGFCVRGNTTLNAAVFNYSDLNPMNRMELQSGLLVDVNYVVEPVTDDAFLLAWSRNDVLDITIVSYVYDTLTHILKENETLVIPVFINGVRVTDGVLTDLQLVIDSDHSTLRVVATIRHIQTPYFSGWVSTVSYPIGQQKEKNVGLNGHLLPVVSSQGQAFEADNIGLQLMELSAGNYWGIWQTENTQGCIYDIYIAQYQIDVRTNQLALIKGAFLVNDMMQGHQYRPQAIPSISAIDRVVLVWISQPNVALQPNMNIYYQLLTAAIEPLLLRTDCLQLECCAFANQIETCGFLPETLQIVANRDGGFLISWLGDQWCNDTLQLCGRRLNLQGNIVSFEQAFSFEILDGYTERSTLNYTEDTPFIMPSDLITVYSPAGNIIVQLRFTPSNLASTVLNVYTESEQLNVSSPTAGEWHLIGHFYHVNQVWSSLYFAPTADFNGDSQKIEFRIIDEMNDTNWQIAPISLIGIPVNDAPRAIMGQIPWQFSQLDEDISLDLTTLIYDVDNLESALTFEVGPCLYVNQTVNATDAVSCDQQLSDLHNFDPDAWDIPCQWLFVQSHWLKGMLPEVGDWCVAIEAKDGQATSTLSVPFQAVESSTVTDHLTTPQIAGIAVGTAAASLLGLLLTWKAREKYREDSEQTREHKKQLIQQWANTELKDLRQSYLPFITKAAITAWGQDYLFYNPPHEEIVEDTEDNWQPSIYISAAANDAEGREWAVNFLILHLAQLGFRVYFGENHRERVTTFVLVIPSSSYSQWYNEAENESTLIEAALNRVRGGSAVIVVFRPNTGYTNEMLPEVLHRHEEDTIPQRRLPLFAIENAAENMAVLFSLLRCIAPETSRKIQNTENRFYNYAAQVNRRTRQMIEKEINRSIGATVNVLTGANSVPTIATSRFSFFAQRTNIEPEREPLIADRSSIQHDSALSA